MTRASVRMTIEWRVPLGQTRSMTMALHSLAAETRTLHGCVGCSVSTDLTQQGIVRYAEEWQNELDLRHRLQSDAFGQLATLIEDSSQPPRIEFELAGSRRGLDFVEEVRSLHQ